MRLLLSKSMEVDRSIFNPIGQRVYGLAHILEGTLMLAVGSRAPSITYNFILNATKKRGELREALRGYDENP